MSGRQRLGGASTSPAAYDAGRVDLKAPSGSLSHSSQQEFNSIKPIDPEFDTRDFSCDRITILLLALFFVISLVSAGVILKLG